MRPEDFRQAQQLHSEIQSFEEAIEENKKFSNETQHMMNDIVIELKNSNIGEKTLIIKNEFIADVTKFLLEKYQNRLETLKEKFNQI